MSFSRRHPLLLVFFLISILRKGPADLPASRFLLVLLLVTNALLGVAGFLIEYPLDQSLLRMFADMVISLGLIYAMLFLAGRGARAVQTITAILGVSIILNILSLPLLFLFEDAGNIATMVAAFLYLIFLWNIVITGHILGKALSVSFPAGLLLALAYVFLTVLIFYSLFPVQ